MLFLLVYLTAPASAKSRQSYAANARPVAVQNGQAENIKKEASLAAGNLKGEGMMGNTCPSTNPVHIACSGVG